MFLKSSISVIVLKIILLMPFSCPQLLGMENKCKQEFSFHKTPRQFLTKKIVPNYEIDSTDIKITTAHKTRFFIQRRSIENGDSVIIPKNDASAIELQVQRHKYRPHKASWVNEKILYLEVWFNPHFGAYWIYDVEAETILANELMNDGFTTFLQCEEFHLNNDKNTTDAHYGKKFSYKSAVVDKEIPPNIRKAFNDDDGKKPIRSISVDLNNDSIPEKLIPNDFLCGNGNCPWIIYSPKHKKVIGKLFGYSVIIQDTLVKGYKVIKTEAKLGSNKVEMYIYKFQEGLYKKAM